MMSSQSLLEQELDQMYAEVRKRAADLDRSSKHRRYAAYALKAIAAGGGLFVATGLVPQVHQGIGIAVMVAVFVDSLFSNHDRLIAETEAGYAFETLGNRVKRSYNRDVSGLIERLRSGDGSAQAGINELMRRAHRQLDEGLARIRDELHSRNVKALRALSLESERAEGQKDREATSTVPH